MLSPLGYERRRFYRRTVRCALVRLQGQIAPTAARGEKTPRTISSSAAVQEGPPVVHPVHRRLEPRRPERVVEVAVIVRARLSPQVPPRRL